MKTYAISSLLIFAVISAASAFAAPVTSVHFESTHGTNINSGLRHSFNSGVWTDTVGDFNGNGTSNDYSRLLPLSTSGAFISVSETIAGRNTVVHAGAQTINYEATEHSDFDMFRYASNGNLQARVPTTVNTEELGFAFAPHVRKSNFMNGADALDNVRFANQADGFRMTFTLSGTGARSASLLVQAGSDWYVSEAFSNSNTANSTLSVNPYTENWFLLDPASLMYTGSTSVLGSSLTDIQSLGVIMRNTVDGSDISQDKMHNVREFSAVVIPEPATVALLAGLAGLGFAILRRRRY